jgi:uncharacterized protein
MRSSRVRNRHMEAAESSPGDVRTVEVAYALPDRQRIVTLPLPTSGLTAGEAVERSGLLREFPEITTHALVLGVYGAICEASRPLRDGDRVEIYRPLRHDPRATRRERVAQARRKPRSRPP